MSIQKFIEKVCVQTAVYWGNPTPDGYGGYTFDAPVEIPCRWEIKRKLIRNIKRGKPGGIIISKARVLVTQVLKEGGYLYLGNLVDITGLEPDDVLEAYRIKRFDKISMIKSTTEFVRIAYL